MVPGGGVVAPPRLLLPHWDAAAAGDKEAVEDASAIFAVSADRHHLTLMCRDLSEIASSARRQVAYRLLKATAYGSCIVHPSKEPGAQHGEILFHQAWSNRPAHPDHRVALALLEALGEQAPDLDG